MGATKPEQVFGTAAAELRYTSPLDQGPGYSDDASCPNLSRPITTQQENTIKMKPRLDKPAAG